LVQRVRPDVLLSTGNRGHWVARLALIGLRRPLLLLRLSNSMDVGRKDFGLRALSARLRAARADKLFIVGAATGASPALAEQIASGRAQAIPNGVDRERANRLATAPPPPNYPGTDRPIVLSIGRLAPQKDFPTLVRAAAIASAKVPLRLVIVGKGDEQAQRELRAVAAAAGLDEEVFRLGGETDNVFAWLSRAAVFVLPSRWEGSSVALLEALAINVPVVATRQAGDACEVLDNGRYGLLVEAGDAEAMAAAILRQLSPERIRPGNRVSHYTVEAMLDLYAEGVNSALEHARRER
jgi:glycosyltransferase involved in cell wall biosynthesis